MASVIASEVIRLNFERTFTVLFGDIETEGKKQGYAEAGTIYGDILRRLQEDIFSAKKYYENVESNIDKKNNELLDKLERLNMERESLREKVEKRYEIPRDTLCSSCLSAGGVILAGLGAFVYYEYRKKKLLEAKARGFEMAKKEYEEKINKERDNLSLLKRMKRNHISEKMKLMDDLLDEIVKVESEIAELRILLAQ